MSACESRNRNAVGRRRRYGPKQGTVEERKRCREWKPPELASEASVVLAQLDTVDLGRSHTTDSDRALRDAVLGPLLGRTHTGRLLNGST